MSDAIKIFSSAIRSVIPKFNLSSTIVSSKVMLFPFEGISNNKIEADEVPLKILKIKIWIFELKNRIAQESFGFFYLFI